MLTWSYGTVIQMSRSLTVMGARMRWPVKHSNGTTIKLPRSSAYQDSTPRSEALQSLVRTGCFKNTINIPQIPWESGKIISTSELANKGKVSKQRRRMLPPKFSLKDILDFDRFTSVDISISCRFSSMSSCCSIAQALDPHM